MIIGNGQLAQAFKGFQSDDVCVFASGVSNSGCQDLHEFQRERELLLQCLSETKGKKFIYFSSCALTPKGYPLNSYYYHKAEMEQLIACNSDRYYIFRIPQLFGRLKLHPTLINHLFFSVLENKEILLRDQSYRYVIDIADVYSLVLCCLSYNPSGRIIMDLANPYRYRVSEIVSVIEECLDLKAVIKKIAHSDGYTLPLDSLTSLVQEMHLNINFGAHYFRDRLISRIAEYNNQF